MKYFYDTLSKLRVARDKAAKRVNEEESRLELYSQKDEGAIKLGAALRFNEHLMSLTMCDAEIGPVGATALSAAVKVHPTLTHLSLKHNPLLAEGAEAIFRATRRNGVCGLAELDLYDCAIGPEGATMLAAQLYKNKTLEDLRLRYNQMGPEGALAIASMLMENRVLVDLDLMLNEMQMAGGLAFERVLKNTVIVEVDKGDDISKLKKLLKLAKKKITDPFWDDVKAGGGVDTSGGQKVPGQVDDREDGEKGNSAEGEADLEEEDLKGEESVDKKEDSEESEEEEEEENSVVDGGGGESKGDASKKNKMEEKKKKPKKLSRRAQRKADAEKAERDRKIRANLRFWMRSTLYTYDEVKADYHAQFKRATKRRSCSLVLFAGTVTQCAKALEFFDNETWAVAINPKNDVIKEINLGQNNFERDFRRQPGQMKRLLGSTIKGLWQDVADFFRPTIMNF